MSTGFRFVLLNLLKQNPVTRSLGYHKLTGVKTERKPGLNKVAEEFIKMYWQNHLSNNIKQSIPCSELAACIDSRSRLELFSE